MQAFLVKLITSIFEKLFKSSKPTLSDGAGRGKTEETLEDQIRRDDW